jgi:spore photoproduct lyase
MEILMINRIFIEEAVIHNEQTKKILDFFPKIETEVIDQVENYWGRVKKPYLQKRDKLNLYIGNKKGELVKEAPMAYGLGDEKHYYYIHAYNCIYECQYCYLQGYFHTPDLVMFVNHDEIIAQMQQLVDADPNQNPWFHAGEYSDSLALSHISDEWEAYWDFFKRNPKAKLEIRTKSVNTRVIEKLGPLPNVFVSFTIAPTQAAKDYDNKCPPSKARIKTIAKLVKQGFKIGIHFDPIVYQDDVVESYQELIDQLSAVLPDHQLGYISIGVVRFTKDVYREVENNYPKSKMFAQTFNKSFDGKIRYNRPMRMWLMNSIKQLCLNAGYDAPKIYLCMEENE